MGQKENSRQLRKAAERLVEEHVLPNMNQRLDSIEKFCKEELMRQDKRAKGVQSFIVQEVKNVIAEELYQQKLNNLALMEVLAAENLAAELLPKIDKQKLVIDARLREEAQEQMKKQLEEQQKRVEEEKAKAVAEAPQPQVESAAKAE